jgi:D-glycero-D-manno-heptose 1,7-bisphosphate phosphatase
VTGPPADLAAVFLDRDGTINRKPAAGDYVKSPAELSLLPGAAAGIALLNRLQRPVIVVTNQRGVALGRMSEGDLEEIHAALKAKLAEEGARIDAIQHCPHAESVCDCRKPATGMFTAAQEQFPEIRFERSLIVGDSWRDMKAGHTLGMTRVLIADGSADAEDADLVVPSLLEAARWATGPRTRATAEGR